MGRTIEHAAATRKDFEGEGTSKIRMEKRTIVCKQSVKNDHYREADQVEFIDPTVILREGAKGRRAYLIGSKPKGRAHGLGGV